jgi:hypothetical protein
MHGKWSCHEVTFVADIADVDRGDRTDLLSQSMDAEGNESAGKCGAAVSFYPG